MYLLCTLEHSLYIYAILFYLSKSNCDTSPFICWEFLYCFQVLIASGLSSDSSLPNNSMVEAPLTINIPVGQSSRRPSENSRLSGSIQGTNITIPVSVQKSEGFDANGSTSGSHPVRKKRKPWSAAEDMELIAAVQKCGEGNWANILKGDFKGDRSASQLSQVLFIAYVFSHASIILFYVFTF